LEAAGLSGCKGVDLWFRVVTVTWMELQHYAREVHILNGGLIRKSFSRRKEDWNGLVLLLRWRLQIKMLLQMTGPKIDES